MTLRYKILGIPGNVDEFLEKARKDGVKEVDLIFKDNIKKILFNYRVYFESLILDNGRKFPMGSSLVVSNSYFNVRGSEDFGRDVYKGRRMERLRIAEKFKGRIKSMGLEVRVDLKDSNQREMSI